MGQVRHDVPDTSGYLEGLGTSKASTASSTPHCRLLAPPFQLPTLYSVTLFKPYSRNANGMKTLPSALKATIPKIRVWNRN